MGNMSLDGRDELSRFFKKNHSFYLIKWHSPTLFWLCVYHKIMWGKKVKGYNHNFFDQKEKGHYKRNKIKTGNVDWSYGWNPMTTGYLHSTVQISNIQGSESKLLCTD